MPPTADDLVRQINALADRVERLEGERDARCSVEPKTPFLDEGQFWILSGIQERLSDHPSTEDGMVAIAGSLALPDGAPVAWQQSASSGGLFETDWSERAAAFNALGHPVRLELLRHILSGVHATAELAAIAPLGTTGQLHHHLRQLVSTGWVRQGGRGSYEVPAARIVPLLACLMGAEK